MNAVIVNYRRGRRTQRTNQMVIDVTDSTSKEDAEKLLGKKVSWTSPGGKKIEGEVTRIHGGKGNIVARFERGLPGQAIGTEVELA